MALGKDLAKQKEVALQTEKPQQRVNPAIDEKLNKFIAENKDLADYYRSFEKEALVRKLMLPKMMESDRRERENAAIVAAVKANPELAKQLEQRVKNVPAENRQAAEFSVSRRIMQEQGKRAIGIGA